MQKTSQSLQFDFKGFGLIDFIIIGTVIGILAFIVLANIVAHNY